MVMPGGGCVVGPVNEEGVLTGDDIAYLYPDFHTALLGHFSDGQLVRWDQSGPLSLVEECRGSSLIGRELPQ